MTPDPVTTNEFVKLVGIGVVVHFLTNLGSFFALRERLKNLVAQFEKLNGNTDRVIQRQHAHEVHCAKQHGEKPVNLDDPA